MFESLIIKGKVVRVMSNSITSMRRKEQQVEKASKGKKERKAVKKDKKKKTIRKNGKSQRG